MFFYRNIKTIIQNIKTPKGQINWKVLYKGINKYWCPAARELKLINLTLWPLRGASVSRVTHTLTYAIA